MRRVLIGGINFSIVALAVACGGSEFQAGQGGSSGSGGSGGSSASGGSSGSAGDNGGSCDSPDACAANEFCDFELSDCGQTAAGTCLRRPLTCDPLVQPVCGCDRQVYQNACQAKTSGVDEGPAGTCSPCPSTIPRDGDVCLEPGLECTYGGGPRPECRVGALCNALGAWEVTRPDCTMVAVCPSSLPTNDTFCDATLEGPICEYGERICVCSNCSSGVCGTDGYWNCTEPPLPPCPALPPNAGQPCDMSGGGCHYGACGGDSRSVSATCDDGLWHWEELICAS
jgi:hypothetical protein